MNKNTKKYYFKSITHLDRCNMFSNVSYFVSFTKFPYKKIHKLLTAYDKIGFLKKSTRKEFIKHYKYNPLKNNPNSNFYGLSLYNYTKNYNVIGLNDILYFIFYKNNNNFKDFDKFLVKNLTYDIFNDDEDIWIKEFNIFNSKNLPNLNIKHISKLKSIDKYNFIMDLLKNQLIIKDIIK